MSSRAEDAAKVLAASSGETDHFHAGCNIPGYLPESDGIVTTSYDAAKSFLVGELDRAGDHVFDAGETEDERGIADEYSAAMEDLNLTGEGDADGSWSAHLPTSTSKHDLGIVYWINRCSESDCEVDDQEYNEESIYDYGLSLERKVLLHLTLSTGGPADGLDILCDSEGDVERVTYWFQDWFDGARRDVERDSALWQLAEWHAEIEREIGGKS